MGLARHESPAAPSPRGEHTAGAGSRGRALAEEPSVSMKTSMKPRSIGLVAMAMAMAGGACASEAEPDPCAEPGVACVWAGIGERGFNIQTPDAHRLQSKLYFPEDLTFGPDGRAYIVDWNNHRIRRVEKNDKLTVVIGTDYEGDGPPEME